MKTFLPIIIVLILAINLFSQEAELITDFNSGPDDSYNEWYYNGIAYKDAIFLPLMSNEVGLELGIVKNGELSILKDINIGAEDSEPKSFTIYKDVLYFIAEDDLNGPALWKTDGTENGTEIFHNDESSQSSNIRTFIPAENGWLYYNIDEVIFRTDGEVIEDIFDGASIGYIYSSASKNFCNYKDGIAFVSKNSDYSFSLTHINDDEAVELAKTEKTSYFAEAFGLAVVSNGLMFSIYDSDDHDGIYVYNETDTSLNTLKVENELIPSRRTIDFNDDINICWIAEKGYYSINGKDGEEQLLISSDNFSASQGAKIQFAKYGDKLVFIPIAGIWFEDDFLVYTDGTTDGTEKIKDIQNQYLSGMLAVDKYAFIVEGISNNYKPNIILINVETGEAEDFYTFEERSKQINSIKLIAFLDDYLYFISNLDEEIGAELYRIKTNLSVNITEGKESYNMNLKQLEDHFIIEMESDNQIDVRIYNSAGQKLFAKEVQSNQTFIANLRSGLYFLNYSCGKESRTEAVYIK